MIAATKANKKLSPIVAQEEDSTFYLLLHHNFILKCLKLKD